jgi:hypothetical protein
MKRFSDGRSRMDGQNVIVYDYFIQNQGITNCAAEQFGFYFGYDQVWYQCLANNLASTGNWAMQVLRESDGAPLTGSTQSYIWGWSDRIFPGGDVVYLTEVTPSSMRFDFGDVAPTPLSMRSLSHGSWVDRGTLPVAGRPRIVYPALGGSRGVGSSTAFTELSLYDIDGDGLLDFQLVSGGWAGWSAAQGAWIMK